MSVAKREMWGSRLAFVMAAAGSAVGLGNIWRFPTVTGENGGAAFVVIYLACVFFVGLPIMWCELVMGRRSKRNPVGAFSTLAPGSWWKTVGGLQVIGGMAILSYYSVVAGWTIGYAFKTIRGDFAGNVTPDAVLAQFGAFVSNPLYAILGTAIFLVLTVLIVAGGVRSGIERWTKILMPALFIMLVLVVIRSVTLPGASEGLAFYMLPDLGAITAETILSAMGQAFFSLSLGMGVMITYGSYIADTDDLIKAGIFVAIADTLVALLAGFAIFPALFAVGGLEPTEGPGLIFVVLPNVFHSIPLGNLFGTLFFILLVVAALTSTVSLLEVVTSYLVDEVRWSRAKAVCLTGLLCFLFAIPSALSAGAVEGLSKMYVISGKDKGFLDLMDFLFGNVALMLGGLLIALFVSWRMGLAVAKDEIEKGHGSFSLFRVWAILIRYLCPTAVTVLLIQKLWTQISGLLNVQ
ncbi:MAG: sodium-dependent transporter [Proteobacteria bacterium]|jgi:neurotransmitter:Na+ symporter, NSS family|nr:sodium-dependent transporter [Pseudomonadota bacterium]